MDGLTPLLLAASRSDTPILIPHRAIEQLQAVCSVKFMAPRSQLGPVCGLPFKFDQHSQWCPRRLAVLQHAGDIPLVSLRAVDRAQLLRGLAILLQVAQSCGVVALARTRVLNVPLGSFQATVSVV